MVHSPVKTTHRNASINLPSRHLVVQDSQWISKGIETLLKSGEWVSPVSKTAYAKRHTATGAVKSATIATFNSDHVVAARAAVSRRRTKIAPASENLAPNVIALQQQVVHLEAELKRELQAKGERIHALRKEIAEIEREKETQHCKFDDAIKTSMRENYRLKNDLRVMITRATEYRDERDLADKMVVSLKRSAELESLQSAMQIEAERNKTLQLMEGFNAQVKELKEQRALVTALQLRCRALEAENDELAITVEKQEEQAQTTNSVLQRLMEESENTIAALSASDNAFFERVAHVLLE